MSWSLPNVPDMPQQQYNRFTYPYLNMNSPRPQSYANSYGVAGQGMDPFSALQLKQMMQNVNGPQNALPPDIAGIIKNLMANMGGGGGTVPPVPPIGGGANNTAQGYLNEIRGLIGKLGNGMLPALSPEMQRELDQRRASGQRAINEDFWNRTGNVTAGLFGQGMENSGLARNMAQNLAVDTQRAGSQLESDIFNQEMGMRQGLWNNQNQGLMSEIGVLRDLMNNSNQQDFQNQQFAREDRNFGLQSQQMNQQNMMQMLQAILQMIQGFRR